MHIMLACHFDNAGTRRKTFLDDPTFLGRRPTPPPLRTRQNRNLAHVCSFACKSLSKLSQAKLQPGRRPSPEGYAVSYPSAGSLLGRDRSDGARLIWINDASNQSMMQR